ncbi:hypothetical protein TRVA0_006S02740 [Trichomonascus vanleenenianus]|uniref:Cyk3p n=1 Tax=Trichomonascus vanleenenianus TaxID=2268995 RepID=UPI003ECB32BF
MVTTLPASLPCLVKAIYSWSGEEKSDLGFVEGDVIEVLNTGDGNWWTGRLKRNKMVGTFPCNFVDFIDPMQAAPPLPAKETAQSTMKHKSSALSVHRRAPKDDRYPPGHFRSGTAVEDGDYSPPKAARQRRSRVAPMKSTSSMRREVAHSPSRNELAVRESRWDHDDAGRGGTVKRDILSGITAELNQTQPYIAPMAAEQHLMPSGYDYYADEEEYLNHRQSSIRSQRRQTYYGEDDLQFYSEDDNLVQPPVPPPHRVVVTPNLQADLKYHHSQTSHHSQASQHSFTSQPSYHSSQPSYHSSQPSYHSSQLSRNSFDSMGMGGRNSFVSSNSSPTRHDDFHMKSGSGYYEPRRRDSFNNTSASPSPPVPIHRTRSNSNVGLNLDRTPSPLRNAMDDVIASLDDMEITSQSRSNSITGLDGSGVTGRFDGPGYKRYSNTTITSEQRGFPPTPSKVSPRSHNSYYMPIADESDERAHHEEEEDDNNSNFMPFDPNSYNSKPEEMLRKDTHKSQSSFSMSMRSDSTTPTTLSNASASSAGSLMRRKQESELRAQTGAYAPSNSVNQQPMGPHTLTEVPVKLPNARPSPTETKKQLPLKRSTGFLKKLFTGHSGESESQSQAPQAHSKPVGFGHTDMSVKRSKSKSSRYSTSSLKKGLRKASSKTFGKSSSIDRSSKNTWIDVRRDVHRANTLTDCEREQRRQKRELEGFAVLEPLDALASVQGNETIDGYTRGEGRLELRNQDFTHVDSIMLSHHTWPQMMTPSVFATSRIGRQFQYDIERARAIFDFCASKINIESHHDDDDDDDDDEYDHHTFDASGQVVSFSRLMKSRRATVRELAECVKSMCDALDIPCEIVRGHLKAPGEQVDLNSQPRPNHYWNAVIIDDQWRFLDTALASPSFPSRDSYYKCDKGTIVNHFYFLTSPSELIYSHIPLDPYDQHLVPPLNPVEALALPLAGPAAFEHNLKIVDYNTSVSQLENLDVAEFNLLVPHGVDLYAEVSVGAFSGNMYDQPMKTVLGLAQPYWKNNRRYVRVKGVVPESFNEGTLHIYIGPRGQSQAAALDTMSLAYSIPLTHTGQNAPFEFVTRHTTPHSEKQDIYVTQPQCKKLIGGSTYVFQVEQHPSRGLGGGYGYGRTKLAVQSPSGRIHKLNKKDDKDDGLSYGSWETTVKVVEVGTWRALVLADRGNAWSVFAEWDCV